MSIPGSTESVTSALRRSPVGLTLAFFIFSGGASTLLAQGRVFVFGVDGLSPKGIAEAKTPNIHALMKSGSWTMHMRSVRETSSSPNWGSQIMGAPVELTGITSNAWQPDKHEILPACQDAPGVFPTIFGLERQQHPSVKIGVFAQWKDFVRLFEPGVATTVYAPGKPEDDIFEHALAYLESDKPEFLFLHIDAVDDAGHSHGWFGPEYLAAVEKVDTMMGRLLAKLDQLDLHKSTTIFLVADHGGKAKSHGGDSMGEIEIPWVISGPGIKPDNELKSPVLMQYDTAATIARVLDVKPSPCWRGQSIDAAFKKPR